MNITRINKYIAARLKLPATTITKTTAFIIDKIAKELRTSKKPLRLAGLGRFKITTVKSHPGYDITTGGTREFPKSVRIHFKTDKRFKTILNRPIKERQDKDRQDWLAAKEMKKTPPPTVSPPDQKPADHVSPPETLNAPVSPPTQTETVQKEPIHLPEPAPLLDIPEHPAPSAETAPPSEPSLVDWEKKNEPSEIPAEKPTQENIVKEDPPMETQETSAKAPAEVQQVIKETADYIQRRMLIIFGSIIGGLIVIFTTIMLLTFHSKGFYNFLKTRVMMVNEENRLTYEQIDELVAQRMKELELDLSQTKDIFKNELYAMQDNSEKKIRSMIMSDVVSELKKAQKSSRTTAYKAPPYQNGKPLIKIIKYTVRKGDNLWKISELKSRNPYNWVGIYETNGHQIKNPNLIYPGQVILIPIIINS